MMLFYFFSIFLRFNPEFVEREGYTIISFKESVQVGESGGPSIPVIPLLDVKSIKIVDSMDIRLKSPIFPFQKLMPLSFEGKIEFINPEFSIYEKYTHISPLKRVSSSSFLFYPVRLISPDSVRVYTGIEVEYKNKFYEDTFAFDYLLITTSNMKLPFENLIKWRQRMGLRTKLVLYEDILSQTEGRDGAEKLRNFVKEMYGVSKFKFLVLGGDIDRIPFRKSYAMSSGINQHEREDSLPCDFYFADIDGNWDANENGVFGEIEDNVDLEPDLMVGRIPVSTYVEANDYCNKLILYEKGEYNDYQRDVLFTASILWETPYTDGSILKDKIKKEYLNNKVLHFLHVYEREGEGREEFLDWMNYGVNVVNQNGHAWINRMKVGKDFIENEDVDGLKNRRAGLMFALGCWTAAFDFDCIAEHFIKNPDGGAVAYIGNSSYGWASPGNPEFGYSAFLDKLFFKFLYSDSFQYIGEVFNRVKSYFTPLAHEENLFRWYIYEVNLLGDPAMRFFTEPPHEVEISVDDTVYFKATPLHVVYRNNPVDGALVSFFYEDSLLLVDTTDENGKVDMDTILFNFDSLEVWVSGKNIKPSYKVIHFNQVSSEPLDIIQPSLSSPCFPGDTLFLSLLLINKETEPLDSLLVEISTNSPLSIIDSTLFLDTLNGGETLKIDNIKVTTDSILKEIGININIFSKEKKITSRNFSLSTGVGWLELKDYRVSRPPFLTTEGIISLTFFNPGSGKVEDMKVYGLCEEAHSDTILLSSEPMDTITGFLRITLDRGKIGDFLSMVIYMESENISTMDTIYFVTSYTGFSDDFEEGLKKWTLSSKTVPHWHITDYRSYSENFSLYCGDSLLHILGSPYVTTIVSSSFYLPVQPILSFKRYLQLPTYGSTGMYVIVESETQAETLDFIGGGEPPLLSFESYWREVSYPITIFQPGTVCRLKFSFVNREDNQKEGIYIDDIKVSSFNESIVDVDTLLVTLSPSVGDEIPITIELDRFSDISISLYDVLGRKRKYDFYSDLPPGEYRFLIDSRDNKGHCLPEGIYYMVVEIEGEQITKKVILLH